jgi:FkbM family methyltransferase
MITKISKKLKNKAYRYATRYIQWADNFSYEFEKNGEKWILEATQNLDFKVLIDVGANVGAWTEAAAKIFPKAMIHSFELSPDTFQTLNKNVNLTNVKLNNAGLSNEDNVIEYKDYGKDSEVCTLLLNSCFHDKRIDSSIKQTNVVRGDTYADRNNIDFIDFLKIDVEGAEKIVLEGFSNKLTEQKIRMVQFEYGYCNGDLKFLMRDFFKLFEEYGYIVGRLRDGNVEFREWTYLHNNFESGPNYVAIRKSDEELYQLLYHN